MSRTMFDSVTPGDIPQSAQMVAGYVSGPYAWPASGWALFPTVPKVRIATSASVNDGHVLDVESGDATPSQAPGWAMMRRASGLATPAVYMSLSVWASVQAAFSAAGVAQPLYWVAAWDGVAQIPSGAIAKQYANSAMTGGHYDASVVADYWPGVDSLPTPPCPPIGSIVKCADTGATFQVGGDHQIHQIWSEQVFIDCGLSHTGEITFPTQADLVACYPKGADYQDCPAGFLGVPVSGGALLALVLIGGGAGLVAWDRHRRGEPILPRSWRQSGPWSVPRAAERPVESDAPRVSSAFASEPPTHPASVAP